MFHRFIIHRTRVSLLLIADDALAEHVSYE